MSRNDYEGQICRAKARSDLRSDGGVMPHGRLTQHSEPTARLDAQTQDPGPKGVVLGRAEALETHEPL